MHKKVLRTLLLLAFIVLGGGHAYAGGLWLYEGSIPDMGMAKDNYGTSMNNIRPTAL